MAKRYDIVALGECLIDFSQLQPGTMDFRGNPGGAPANVLAAAARLGNKTAFIGKVGQDPFGLFLRDSLKQAGIDTAGLLISPAHNTTLAFVALDGAGERSFRFYRRHTADVELSFEEVPLRLLQEGRIFHFGSVSLTDLPAGDTTLRAVAYAKSHGSVISFDPNYRAFLWDSEERARKAIQSGLALAQLVKLSQEEAALITGEEAPEQAARALLKRYPGVRLLAVTCGEKGAWCFCGGLAAHQPAYAVSCVDTTGAGDAFWGAMLHRLLTADLALPGEQQALDRLTAWCCAAGSLTTTKSGAIPALPTGPQIDQCVAQGATL